VIFERFTALLSKALALGISQRLREKERTLPNDLINNMGPVGYF